MERVFFFSLSLHFSQEEKKLRENRRRFAIQRTRTFSYLALFPHKTAEPPITTSSTTTLFFPCPPSFPPPSYFSWQSNRLSFVSKIFRARWLSLASLSFLFFPRPGGAHARLLTHPFPVWSAGKWGEKSYRLLLLHRQRIAWLKRGFLQTSTWDSWNLSCRQFFGGCRVVRHSIRWRHTTIASLQN